MRVAFQMDPIQSIDIESDTTFRLAEEAQKRGHSLFYYLPYDLEFSGHDVFAWGHNLTVFRRQKNYFALGPREKKSLSNDFDVIWLRQDPPFNMSYITSTFLLDNLKGKTKVVNDPFWVRNFPEKLLVLSFPSFIPPTVIGRNFQSFRDFREQHGDVIIKPLYGNGGAGVFKLTRSDPNLSALLELFNDTINEPVIIQKYLSEVEFGDKRVLLVNGEAVGAINRIPQKGEIRSNMHVGGIAEKSDLSEQDLKICEAVGALMKEKGQVLVGLDIIGKYLTEINLTSPTGVQELERFSGLNIAELIWNCLEN